MMNWKLALTALLASSGTTSLFASAQCNPKPTPVRDIKFSDVGAEGIHNFELHGNARIVEPAPLDIPRALRIDQLFSYALLKNIDISPSKMRDATMAIGVYVESIRPAIQNAPNPDQNEAYGWVMSHDNGGYDRAIFLHDERFGGVGMSAGFIPEAEPLYIPLQEWVQVVAVWRQDGECSLYIQNEKINFAEAVIGKNNDGLPSIAIGAPQLRKYGKENDNDFWIKDVKIFDYALSDQEVEDLNCVFIQTLEPTIDCGQGGDLVFSCTECVSGDGSASGCAGDCKWTPDAPNCVEKEDDPDGTPDDTVNCGDHDAADCSQCGVSADGSSGCSGDCKFDDASGTCVDYDYAPTCDGEWVNVALETNGGIASQSPGVYDSGAVQAVPEYAIDGNTSGLWNDKTVACGNWGSNPWWKVQFERTIISDVVVYNRVCCCSERIVGFIVEIFDGGKVVYSSLHSASQESSTTKSVYHFDIPSVMGDTVKIRIPKSHAILQIAEVEVMGCRSSTGLTCGWKNVALGGVATQSPGVYDSGVVQAVPEYAIDGNTSGLWNDKTVACGNWGSNPWWQVKFDKTVISSVAVYNRVCCCSERIVSFIMEIFDGGKVVYSSLHSASQESSTTKPVYNFEIPQIAGDTVKIRIPKSHAILQIAEVEVMGQKCACGLKNVALGGVATQSPGVYDSGVVQAVPEYAIDGNTSGRWNDKTVACGNWGNNPWWQVKFDKTVISSVFVYNRTCCCSERIVSFIMEILDGGKVVYSSLHSASQESSTTKSVYEFNIPQIAGDTVKIRIPKNNAILQIAEVEVMGEKCD